MTEVRQEPGMTRTLHFACAVAALLLFCSRGEAQMRGGFASGARASGGMAVRQAQPARSIAPARPSFLSVGGAQASRPVRLLRTTPSGQLLSGAGLGRNFRFNPPSTRNRRDGRRAGGAFVPILFGGYPYYDPYYDYADSSDYQGDQQVQQQQDVQQDVQEPAPAPQPYSGVPDNHVVRAVPPAAAAPVRDVDEFILIRRDGKVLFASAYTVIGANLRYVTPEGITRTMPLTELDTDSTRSMNDARGTEIHL